MDNLKFWENISIFTYHKKLIFIQTNTILGYSSGWTSWCYKLLSYYRSQRSWAKVMFLQASVILLTGGGCLPGTHPRTGTPPPPGTRYTPSDQVHPPGTRYWNAFLFTVMFVFCDHVTVACCSLLLRKLQCLVTVFYTFINV